MADPEAVKSRVGLGISCSRNDDDGESRRDHPCDWWARRLLFWSGVVAEKVPGPATGRRSLLALWVRVRGRQAVWIPRTLMPGEIAGVGAGKMGDAHQILVDRPGGFAPFVNGPHHQRLAAAHVAGGKHALDAASCNWRRT